MKALVCEQLGDPCGPLNQGVLHLRNNYPKPDLPPKHVRIQVSAASLNFPDALQIKGQYQVKPKLPFIPGSEVAGTVVEVAEGVRAFKIGDRVVAVRSGAAFAEECVAHQASVWPVPDGISLSDAAVIPIAYGTSDLALRHRAQLKPGQTVLVLGAAGGVGLAAVQIAKLVGARVIAVVNGEEKTQFIQSMGADVVIDASSSKLPLSKQIKALHKKGVDVVFDPVGGDMLKEALKVVAWGAQYLVIGFASGTIPTVATNILLVKNVTMHGIFWGSYMENNWKVLADGLKQLLEWVCQGQLKVNISHRFPLEKADRAFKTIMDRKVMGKVIFTMERTARL